MNEIRRHVDQWRTLPHPRDWGVTPETARLLQHWRHHDFSDIQPFFCQVEAAETVIWLSEVAPRSGQIVRRLLDRLANANNDANPELSRLALKLATGAGKTTVMAMIIAWQTINAIRHPNSRRFTRGFLVVAPGITIKDRLRVLQPNDPDSYYASRELVPRDMLGDINHARYRHHQLPRTQAARAFGAFRRRGRALLQGRGTELNTLETEGQMLQRVMPDLMGMKDIWVLNDEGHHCYRQKPDEDAEGDLKGEDRIEAEKNKRGCPRLDLRPGDRQAQARRQAGLGPIRHALLPTGIGLCGRNNCSPGRLPISRSWTPSRAVSSNCHECQWPTTSQAVICPNNRILWENIRSDMPKRGRGKAKGESRPAQPANDAQECPRSALWAL